MKAFLWALSAMTRFSGSDSTPTSRPEYWRAWLIAVAFLEGAVSCILASWMNWMFSITAIAVFFSTFLICAWETWIRHNRFVSCNHYISSLLIPEQADQPPFLIQQERATVSMGLYALKPLFILLLCLTGRHLWLITANLYAVCLMIDMMEGIETLHHSSHPWKRFIHWIAALLLNSLIHLLDGSRCFILSVLAGSLAFLLPYAWKHFGLATDNLQKTKGKQRILLRSFFRYCGELILLFLGIISCAI